MTVKRPMWSSESFSARFPVGRILYVIDVLAWMFAILLAALLRYEFAANSISWDIFVGAIAGCRYPAAVLWFGIPLVPKGNEVPHGRF